MTPTKAEELAALADQLDDFDNHNETDSVAYKAARVLRSLSAVEAERDDLKRALAYTVRLVQDWQQSAYAIGAERDALLSLQQVMDDQIAALQTRLHDATIESATLMRVAALEAERDALRADAERYRALRSTVGTCGRMSLLMPEVSDPLNRNAIYASPDALDAAIDAAMKGTKE